MKFFKLCLSLMLTGILINTSAALAQLNHAAARAEFKAIDHFKSETLLKIKALKAKQADSLYEISVSAAADQLSKLHDAIPSFEEHYCRLESVQSADLNPDDKAILQLMDNSGIEIRNDGEGDCFMSYKPYFFYNIFKNKVSPDLHDYLKLTADEDTVLYSGDAAIGIPFAALGERVVNWEMFIKKYPGSKWKEQAQDRYTSYLRDYCFGMDNTLVFEHDQTSELFRLNQENRLAFDEMITRHPNTRTGQFIKHFMQQLKENKYILTETLRASINDKISVLIRR